MSSDKNTHNISCKAAVFKQAKKEEVCSENTPKVPLPIPA